MQRIGSRGFVTWGAPWLAIVAVALMVPGATAGISGSVTAPSGVVVHKWVDITNHSVQTPTARQSYGMAYDPLLPGIILFGGNTASGGALNDTWEFVAGHWKNLNLTGSHAPPSRWAPGLVFDPSMSGVLLYGGQSTYLGGCGAACAYNDTWLFNASGWHQLKLAVAPPPAPAPQLVYDSHDGYDLLVFDPIGLSNYIEEWRFSGGAWHNATSTVKGGLPNLGFFYSDDPSAGYVLLFGGSFGCSGYGITWMYRNGTFHNLTAKSAASPAAKAGSHALGYDPMLGGVLMTGGYDAFCNVVNQTWLFHRGVWTDVSNQTGTAIPGRWDARLVWDAQVGPHGGDVTFSGNEALVGGYNSFGTDTWKVQP